MKRRGQLTIFLVLGMVIILVVGYLIILSSQINNEIITVSEDLPPPVMFYIESVLEDAARSAVIEVIAPQSGYQDPGHSGARHNTVTAFPKPHPVAYYYLLGDFRGIPTLDDILLDLHKETYTRFIGSFNLNVFDDSGFTLIPPEQPPEIIISINEEDISVLLHYPLEILTEEKRILFSNMSILLPLRLRHAHDLSSCMVEEMARYDKSGQQALTECSLDIGEGFTVRSKELDGKGESWFAVVDERVEGNTGTPFEYQFLFWKCSGNYGAMFDEKEKIYACEYACVYEIPEPVLLGICMTETGCEHRDGDVVKKSDDGGIGVMQLTGAACAPSVVDDISLDQSKLPHNVECGAQLLVGKCSGTEPIKPDQASYSCLGQSGWDYCCPNSDESVHICCTNPDHQCCTNPEHPCCTDPPIVAPDSCGRESTERIFGPECKEKCEDVWDPVKLKYVEVCDLNLHPTCCDPRGGPSNQGKPSGFSAGYCCPDSYKLPSPEGGTKTVCGLPVPEGEFKKDEVLTKDAEYAGWDIAIRKYNGGACKAGDPSATFQNDPVKCRIQNYVDLVHYNLYELKDACHSSLSTPLALASASTKYDGCCPDNAVAECEASHTRWWP